MESGAPSLSLKCYPGGVKEGRSPFKTYVSPSTLKERDTKRELKRGEAPLKKHLPLPLDKGKGINPVRVPNGVKGIGLIKLETEVDKQSH